MDVYHNSWWCFWDGGLWRWITLPLKPALWSADDTSTHIKKTLPKWKISAEIRGVICVTGSCWPYAILAVAVTFAWPSRLKSFADHCTPIIVVIPVLPCKQIGWEGGAGEQIIKQVLTLDSGFAFFCFWTDAGTDEQHDIEKGQATIVLQ